MFRVVLELNCVATPRNFHVRHRCQETKVTLSMSRYLELGALPCRCCSTCVKLLCGGLPGLAAVEDCHARRRPQAQVINGGYTNAWLERHTHVARGAGAHGNVATGPLQLAGQNLEDVAHEYLQVVKQELVANLEAANEYSLYVLLNKFGPRAAPFVQPILGHAFVGVLPDLKLEAVSKLVVSMAYSEVRQVPVWHALAAATVAASVNANPRQLAEMAFGFSWVSWAQPDLFATLQARMEKVKELARDEERRAFAWACARVGQPCTQIFGNVSANVDEHVAKIVWNNLELMRTADTARNCHSTIETLCWEPMPLLRMPDAIPFEHGEALLRLADEQRLWINSSDFVATHVRNADAAGARKSARTSATALLAYPQHQTHPSVSFVRTWAASLLDVPENFIEPLQLVRYSRGQEYKPHMDWSPEGDPGLWIFGQRVATILVYLATLPEGGGGETFFEQLGVKVAPRSGSAVIWPNVDSAGAPQPSAIHEARPVLCDDVKYALNIWVRGQPQPDQRWIKWYR